MNEERYQAILSAIADLQASLDALGLDVQRLSEHMGVDVKEEEDISPPPWVDPRYHRGSVNQN